MTLYMLDTDVCASIMRVPSDPLIRRLHETPLERQSISAVTLAELLYGVEVSSKPARNRTALDAFVKHVSVLDWTVGAAEHYGEIRAHLQKKGQMIGSNDLMIAAHARHARATLVTGNDREFRRVPALKVENWMA